MSSDTGHDDDRTAFGDIARDLTRRFADLVQGMGGLGTSVGPGGSAVAAQ